MLLFVFVLGFFIITGYSVPQLAAYPQGKAANASFNGFMGAFDGIKNSINNTYYLPVLGSIPFPNVFGIFSNTFNLLIQVIAFPSNLIDALIDIPAALAVFFKALIYMLMIISIYTWYKGQGQ